MPAVASTASAAATACAAAAVPSASALSPPLEFGGYRLLEQELLGSGSFGKVYVCRLADGEQDGVTFAAKAINMGLWHLGSGPLLESRERSRQRLLTNVQREADILAGLGRHDNIVHFVDLVVVDSWLFFIFERLQGNLLGGLVELNRRLYPAEACHILLQLCRGLKFLHDKGIIHRDLKLENILVSRQRRCGTGGEFVRFDVKITDFGLSKVLDGKLMHTYSHCGNGQYTAPEVHLGEGYNLQADLWSLGIIFIVVLRGSFPKDGEGGVEGSIKKLVEPCQKIAQLMLQRRPADRATIPIVMKAVRSSGLLRNLDRRASVGGRGGRAASVTIERVVRRRISRKRSARGSTEASDRQMALLLQAEEGDEQLARRLHQEEEDAQLALRLQDEDNQAAEEELGQGLGPATMSPGPPRASRARARSSRRRSRTPGALWRGSRRDAIGEALLRDAADIAREVAEGVQRFMDFTRSDVPHV